MSLQEYICKNNIYFYKEYIDIYIDESIKNIKIDNECIYNSSQKLYNFFNNLINNKMVKINYKFRYHIEMSIIRINYLNCELKDLLIKDFKKYGKKECLINYALKNLKLYDDYEMLHFILEHNYDINKITNDNSNILLEILCLHLDINKIKPILYKIINKIDNINDKNEKNKNCIHYCILNDYLEIFAYILKKKNIEELLDYYFFYNCLLYKRYEYLKLSLKKININLENFMGENLLMLGIKFKDLKFIEMCLPNIDINHKNIFGENVILYCILNKYYDILNKIIKIRDKDIDYNIISNLLEYQYLNKYNDILFLLEKGANVNKRNEMTGNIALHDAIILNENPIIELLIQYNSDINIQNNDGYTPLMISVIMNNINSVKLLLSKKVNLYLYNFKNFNALMIAYIFNNEEIFKLILEKYSKIEHCLFCLEKKIQNKNIDLLLLWFKKFIEIVSVDIIKKYFFEYKEMIYKKSLNRLFNNDITNYIVLFLNSNNIDIEKKIQNQVKHIKNELNNIFL